MEPPTFPAGDLRTVTAVPGSVAVLQLPPPSGTSPFQYQWSRTGASLDDRFAVSEDAGGVRLTVSSARTGDTGVYTLQASNAAGKDTARVRLEVATDELPSGDDPPTFLRRLQDLTVKVGTRTRFLVEIVSSTECKVTWYRNERRLLEAERVSLVREGKFWCADVATVSVDDAGRWTCTAENAGGRASCSAHLNVLVPKAYKRPEFVEELRALLTEQGTVSLECKVVGVPTPVLRWFKDSREIKAGDVFALTANAEDPTSLGTYTCEAVNCMGRAYSSSKVHVVGNASKDGSTRPGSAGIPEPPPIFTKELEDQYLKICSPLTLGCHIVVPPWPRSVAWYNKEGKVEAGDRYHVLEDGVGGYLLEVPSAEYPDEGEWKCVATSTGGRVGITTCHVNMEVPKNYRKPRFMENLQAVLTEEGLVSFECKVVGFPTPILSWFKDGQELKPGDVYQLTGTNSLGSYCCIARNCMGQASSSAELTVEDIQNQLNEEEKLQLFSKNQAPKFVQGLKSVEAKIDEPFRFTIKVAIPPEPSVSWYREDQPVDESPRCHHVKEDRGLFHLDLRNLELLDQAEWKCVAINDFGHSVTSCFLKLIIPRHYKKPRFLENLQAILSDEGAVNLECKVIGVPQPILKWYKDGEELKPGDIHRIISGEDGTCCLGTYTCEAQNCMGIAASSASLLGFDDSMKANKKLADEQDSKLSTIHEERTSQMYDTPVGDITLDDKGEISFSFDGKEVSVSLYETPDLTEEEALQIVEMYADQLSENVTEHNVVELPPLRFVKETSTSGNLLMEAIIIDVSPEYFASPDEDLRTEADVEDMSIAEENGLPQLSLDQDIEICGEDFLDKTMALLSDEKSDVPKKLGRKKSDSQRSFDDYFSLSHEASLSEGKKDDDTQVLSESDLQSFVSAHSLSKPKSKSMKDHVSTEVTKTVLDEEVQCLQIEPESPVIKPKRERRSSRSSRRSSSGSEKSISKYREENLRTKQELESLPKKVATLDEQFNAAINNISSSLSKIIDEVQNIERDIILKSELMSSAATASKSLEIISSLITPLSEIHSIADALKESFSETLEVSVALLNSISHPLKMLYQSLTIVEKCVDVESENKTLVKKTCVAFIENCGDEMQKLVTEICTAITKDYIDEKNLLDIQNISKEVVSVLKYSADTIKARNLISEASEIKIEEPTFETKHLRETQKAVFELKSPLNSLLCIAESADEGKIADVSKIKNSEIILNDMSASIQDLQTALEQIESLSVIESTYSLYKYNTEIIETVMESVLKLRSSFEQLSVKSEEDKFILKETLTSIRTNLIDISSHIFKVEKKLGKFDILQSDNKLEVLQKMAQILISLENNLPKLTAMPEIKGHMDEFHKNLTKVLENVIESNEANKYFALIEICDAVNRVNHSIKNMDSDNLLYLASLANTLKIIQDHFVNNVFESELNCLILSSVSYTLVGIQEAINQAEELSLHVDSEHLQDISVSLVEGNKASVIVEHIDQTLAAISNVKVLETTKGLKESYAPTLKSIIPVLEEIKRNLALSRPSEQELTEQVSELSDLSYIQTLATPLRELNQNIVVLNHVIIDNIESIKECEVLAAIADPIHELYNTLQVLQQDVISQYSEDLTPYEVSVNMASAVQNLQSCIVMIQEQAGVEIADDMSTLEDISGIKTTAETIPSDHLVLPEAEETTIEQSLEPFTQELPSNATAQALQLLNEHITVLQNPEIIDALDTLSEVSDYSSLKSIAIGLNELHSGIEEILHPTIMESSNELAGFINTSKIIAIAEPMQELKQSLSILDINNIPIYEQILEMPSEKIQAVMLSVSEFRHNLDKCIHAIFPAMETADKTIEISNKIEILREICEHLNDVITTTKVKVDEIHIEELNTLQGTVNDLLNATDVSKGIKIEDVKFITEELYEKVVLVQDKIIQFVPHSSQMLAQEAKLIHSIDEIETNIAVLEQYDFVDLSRVSYIASCMSPQLAVEIETDSLIEINDIMENAVHILQDSTQDTSIADLLIIEDFFNTCKDEFTILRCLITKQLSHKKIIRLLQEFNSLQTTISDLKIKRLELVLSDDINESLSIFFVHADESIQNIRESLLKIVNSQSAVILDVPFSKLNDFEEMVQQVSLKHESPELKSITEVMSNVVITLIPYANGVKNEIIQELNCSSVIAFDESNLLNNIEKLETLLEDFAKTSTGSKSDQIISELATCFENHHDYKDALGTGKTLILLKCFAECSDILRKNVTEDLEIITSAELKADEGTLATVLTEMLEPLQSLQKQLIDIQEHILAGAEDDSVSINVTSTESMVQTIAELHREVVQQVETASETINEEETSLLKQVDEEIHTIHDKLQALGDLQAVQTVIEIVKPIYNIEKSVQSILSATDVKADVTDKLNTDVNSNIDTLENALDRFLRIEKELIDSFKLLSCIDLNNSLRIAIELRNLLSLGPKMDQFDEQLKIQHSGTLKSHLSEFDWLNTDIFLEGKPSLEVDKLKHVFLTTYQLLTELDKVEISDNEGKLKDNTTVLKHIDQYVEMAETVEKISPFVQMDNLAESVKIAKELRESLLVSITAEESKVSEQVEDKKQKVQAKLAQNLQRSVSKLKQQILDSTSELAPTLDLEILEKVETITSHLQMSLRYVSVEECSVIQLDQTVDDFYQTEKPHEVKTAAISERTAPGLVIVEEIITEVKKEAETEDKEIPSGGEVITVESIEVQVLQEDESKIEQVVVVGGKEKTADGQTQIEVEKEEAIATDARNIIEGHIVAVEQFCELEDVTEREETVSKSKEIESEEVEEEAHEAEEIEITVIKEKFPAVENVARFDKTDKLLIDEEPLKSEATVIEVTSFVTTEQVTNEELPHVEKVTEHDEAEIFTDEVTKSEGDANKQEVKLAKDQSEKALVVELPGSFRQHITQLISVVNSEEANELSTITTDTFLQSVKVAKELLNILTFTQCSTACDKSNILKENTTLVNELQSILRISHNQVLESVLEMTSEKSIEYLQNVAQAIENVQTELDVIIKNNSEEVIFCNNKIPQIENEINSAENQIEKFLKQEVIDEIILLESDTKDDNVKIEEAVTSCVSELAILGVVNEKLVAADDKILKVEVITDKSDKLNAKEDVIKIEKSELISRIENKATATSELDETGTISSPQYAIVDGNNETSGDIFSKMNEKICKRTEKLQNCEVITDSKEEDMPLNVISEFNEEKQRNSTNLESAPAITDVHFFEPISKISDNHKDISLITDDMKSIIDQSIAAESTFSSIVEIEQSVGSTEKLQEAVEMAVETAADSPVLTQNAELNTIETLLLTLQEYTSDFVSDAISDLPTVNTDEVKQSIVIAKELCDIITPLEANQDQVTTKQAILAEQLQKILINGHILVYEKTSDLDILTKKKLNDVVEITSRLHDNLASVFSTQINENVSQPVAVINITHEQDKTECLDELTQTLIVPQANQQEINEQLVKRISTEHIYTLEDTITTQTQDLVENNTETLLHHIEEFLSNEVASSIDLGVCTENYKQTVDLAKELREYLLNAETNEFEKGLDNNKTPVVGNKNKLHIIMPLQCALNIFYVNVLEQYQELYADKNAKINQTALITSNLLADLAVACSNTQEVKLNLESKETPKTSPIESLSVDHIVLEKSINDFEIVRPEVFETTLSDDVGLVNKDLVTAVPIVQDDLRSNVLVPIEQTFTLAETLPDQNYINGTRTEINKAEYMSNEQNQDLDTNQTIEILMNTETENESDTTAVISNSVNGLFLHQASVTEVEKLSSLTESDIMQLPKEYLFIEKSDFIEEFIDEKPNVSVSYTESSKEEVEYETSQKSGNLSALKNCDKEALQNNLVKITQSTVIKEPLKSQIDNQTVEMINQILITETVPQFAENKQETTVTSDENVVEQGIKEITSKVNINIDSVNEELMSIVQEVSEDTKLNENILISNILEKKEGQQEPVQIQPVVEVEPTLQKHAILEDNLLHEVLISKPSPRTSLEIETKTENNHNNMQTVVITEPISVSQAVIEQSKPSAISSIEQIIETCEDIQNNSLSIHNESEPVSEQKIITNESISESALEKDHPEIVPPMEPDSVMENDKAVILTQTIKETHPQTTDKESVVVEIVPVLLQRAIFKEDMTEIISEDQLLLTGNVKKDDISCLQTEPIADYLELVTSSNVLNVVQSIVETSEQSEYESLLNIDEKNSYNVSSHVAAKVSEIDGIFETAVAENQTIIQLASIEKYTQDSEVNVNFLNSDLYEYQQSAREDLELPNESKNLEPVVSEDIVTAENMNAVHEISVAKLLHENTTKATCQDVECKLTSITYLDKINLAEEENISQHAAFVINDIIESTVQNFEKQIDFPSQVVEEKMPSNEQENNTIVNILVTTEPVQVRQAVMQESMYNESQTAKKVIKDKVLKLLMEESKQEVDTNDFKPLKQVGILYNEDKAQENREPTLMEIQVKSVASLQDISVKKGNDHDLENEPTRIHYSIQITSNAETNNTSTHLAEKLDIALDGKQDSYESNISSFQDQTSEKATAEVTEVQNNLKTKLNVPILEQSNDVTIRISEENNEHVVEESIDYSSSKEPLEICGAIVIENLQHSIGSEMEQVLLIEECNDLPITDYTNQPYIHIDDHNANLPTEVAKFVILEPKDVISVKLEQHNVHEQGATTETVFVIDNEHKNLLQHIDQLVSNQITEVVDELASSDIECLKKSINIAKELRENIAALDILVGIEETSPLVQEARTEQARLVHKLQETLSTLQAQVFESAQFLPSVDPESLQQISDVVLHLREDLAMADLSIMDEVELAPDAINSEETSMNMLENLLKNVSDKIDLSLHDKTTEDTEELRDTLDEVQTVIIKLKRDYDTTVYDTLNETLEDLECSVRSVQLQINENSPPELLKEACDTLQLLVNNMNENKDVHATETITKSTVDKALQKCSNETKETVKLLEIALKVDAKDQTKLMNIISNLTILKDKIKILRLSFLDDAETLIEKGIDFNQSLDQIEDKVFSLEKDIENEVDLDSSISDTVMSAVHSIFGSISNMRSTITSIQKQYMYENYGKPSEYLLRSIKNLMSTSKDEEECYNKLILSKFVKSIRKVLNHFEDIKFYVNLDKTARIPSDAAFTKIILEELKTNLSDVMLNYISKSDADLNKLCDKTLQCIDANLLTIEGQTALVVKDKIPMFKKIALHVLIFTNSVKTYKNSQLGKKNIDQKEEEQTNAEATEMKIKEDAPVLSFGIEDEKEMIEDIKRIGETYPIISKHNREEIYTIDDIQKVMLEEVIPVPSTSKYIEEESLSAPAVSDIKSREECMQKEEANQNNEEQIFVELKSANEMRIIKEEEEATLKNEEQAMKRKIQEEPARLINEEVEANLKKGQEIMDKKKQENEAGLIKEEEKVKLTHEEVIMHTNNNEKEARLIEEQEEITCLMQKEKQVTLKLAEEIEERKNQEDEELLVKDEDEAIVDTEEKFMEKKGQEEQTHLIVEESQKKEGEIVEKKKQEEQAKVKNDDEILARKGQDDKACHTKEETEVRLKNEEDMMAKKKQEEHVRLEEEKVARLKNAEEIMEKNKQEEQERPEVEKQARLKYEDEIMTKKKQEEEALQNKEAEYAMLMKEKEIMEKKNQEERVRLIEEEVARRNNEVKIMAEKMQEVRLIKEEEETELRTEEEIRLVKKQEEDADLIKKPEQARLINENDIMDKIKLEEQASLEEVEEAKQIYENVIQVKEKQEDEARLIKHEEEAKPMKEKAILRQKQQKEHAHLEKKEEEASLEEEEAIMERKCRETQTCQKNEEVKVWPKNEEAIIETKKQEHPCLEKQKDEAKLENEEETITKKKQEDEARLVRKEEEARLINEQEILEEKKQEEVRLIKGAEVAEQSYEGVMPKNKQEEVRLEKEEAEVGIEYYANKEIMPKKRQENVAHLINGEEEARLTKDVEKLTIKQQDEEKEAREVVKLTDEKEIVNSKKWDEQARLETEEARLRNEEDIAIMTEKKQEVETCLIKEEEGEKLENENEVMAKRKPEDVDSLFKEQEKARLTKEEEIIMEKKKQKDEEEARLKNEQDIIEKKIQEEEALRLKDKEDEKLQKKEEQKQLKNQEVACKSEKEAVLHRKEIEQTQSKKIEEKEILRKENDEAKLMKKNSEADKQQKDEQEARLKKDKEEEEIRQKETDAKIAKYKNEKDVADKKMQEQKEANNKKELELKQKDEEKARIQKKMQEQEEADKLKKDKEEAEKELKENADRIKKEIAVAEKKRAEDQVKKDKEEADRKHEEEKERKDKKKKKNAELLRQHKEKEESEFKEQEECKKKAKEEAEAISLLTDKELADKKLHREEDARVKKAKKEAEKAKVKKEKAEIKSKEDEEQRIKKEKIETEKIRKLKQKQETDIKIKEQVKLGEEIQEKERLKKVETEEEIRLNKEKENAVKVLQQQQKDEAAEMEKHVIKLKKKADRMQKEKEIHEAENKSLQERDSCIKANSEIKNKLLEQQRIDKELELRHEEDSLRFKHNKEVMKREEINKLMENEQSRQQKPEENGFHKRTDVVEVRSRKQRSLEMYTDEAKLGRQRELTREDRYKHDRQDDMERHQFVDHNHRDYTMEFARPSSYREKTYETVDRALFDRDFSGRCPIVYKTQTLVLDAQLRSSAPPPSTISASSSSRFCEHLERRTEMRQRSKALSEARTVPDKQTGARARDSKRKPVFSTYLTDRTAVEGSRVKLTCSVLSSSDPKITWYKNGVLLDNKLKYRTRLMDGLITLEVLNAVPADSAEYSCTVENENGSVNSVANLKVYPSFEASPIPPTFTRSIRDNYHLAENELILECRIRGQPLPTITWLKDDRLVPSNDRYQAYYLADGVCRLAISAPTPEDSGKYTCKAENSVWSDQITHVVNFTGKESRLSPNIATIERSRFNRQATESRRPHFTNVLSDYQVTSGGTIGLQVEIRGCPTRVEWLREGLSVTEYSRNAQAFVEQGLYTLALTDVTEKESGMYTCRAWSTHGNVDMNAAITVVPPNEMDGKPAMIVGRPEKDVLISVGEDLNISFRVQGEPKPKVVFMKGIRDITSSQRVCKMTSDDYVKFTVKRSVVSDAGTYCILARNAYGCDRAFVTVVVRQRASSDNLISDWTYPLDDATLAIGDRKCKAVPNRIPGEPSVVEGGNNWVSLTWPKPDPSAAAPVLAYKVESWLIGKEGGARWTELGITPLNTFDAFNLKQGSEYHFRITPRNRYGWGESVSTTVAIGVGLAGDSPDFVDILPGQLKVLVGETATLSCSVKGKPTPEVVWMKNGHELDEGDRRVKTKFNGFNCSLTIDGVEAEDEARYSCEASNVHGRASTYARVAVVTDRLIWEADAKLKRERSAEAQGDYPPQFTMRLRDRRVQATYPVRLTCQVVGSPPPAVTWYRDGQEVSADSRHTRSQDDLFHTLEIAPTTLEDGGVYEAMARNSSGAISCRCCLVVDKGIRAYVAPEFCCGLEPLYRLREGDELRVTAIIEAYPSVGVTWYRDGIRLRPSRRVIMTLDRDGQIELALASIMPRDAGVYTCTASNEVGRASTSGKVEVVEDEMKAEKKRTPPMLLSPDVPYSKEPMFIRKPRSSEAREGDTVIIECEVIGDPKPDVYWLRDFLKPDYYRDASHFKRVDAGPEYRFEIPHAKLDYTGAYSVVAKNVHGEAKAIISLQILAKDISSTDEAHNVRYGVVEVIPRFERLLTDLLSHDGDTVQFECRISGNPEPNIRWYHYADLIRDCTDFETYYDGDTARLTIKQVTADDEGTYLCEAANNMGKATSKACLVVYPPGEPNTLSQRLRRPPALLSAASTPRSTPRSTPARSVSRTPGPDPRRLCSPSRTLAPKFYTYPFNKVVEEGDTAVFQCAVNGLPAPWATWDKDGVIISPSSRVSIKEKDEILRILEIEKVTVNDVGLYRISLENDYGRIEACARLEVITQKGKFIAGVRAYSASPRKSMTYRRRTSSSRQD